MQEFPQLFCGHRKIAKAACKLEHKKPFTRVIYYHGTLCIMVVVLQAARRLVEHSLQANLGLGGLLSCRRLAASECFEQF